MKPIKPSESVVITPKQCHLWTKKPLVWNDMYGLVEIERFIEESHFIRKLCRCFNCGQLYYYEFYEEIDWDEGNDPAYRTFYPIRDISVVDYLNSLSYIEILRYTPRLLFDYQDKKHIRWIK